MDSRPNSLAIVNYNNVVCKTEQDAKLIRKFITQCPDNYFNILACLSQIDRNNIDTFINKAISHINISITQKTKKHNLVKEYLKHFHLQIKCTNINNAIHFIQTKLPEQTIINRFEQDNRLFDNTLFVKASQKYAWFEIICKNKFYSIIHKYTDNIKTELFQQIEQEINQLLQLHNYSSLQDMWLEYINNNFKMKISF